MSDVWFRLGRNTGVSLGSQFVIVLCGFFAMYFNSRSLGVEGFGQFVLLISIAALLEQIATSQSWQVVMAMGKGREREIFGGALLFDATALMIAALIGLAIAIAIAPLGIWLMASIALRVQDPAVGLLRLRNKYETIAGVQIAQAITTAIVAYLLWRQGAGLEAYVLWTAAISAAGSLALVGFALREVRPVVPSRAILLEVFRFAVPANLSGTIGTVRQNGIFLLLGLFGGPAAVGIYAVAERVSSVLGMLNTTIHHAIFREIASNTRHLARVVGGISFAIGILAAVVCGILGKDLIRLAAGPEFELAFAPLLILILAHSFSLAGVGMRAATIVLEGPVAMLRCNARAALSLIVAPALIMFLGASGGAYSALFYEVVWLALIWFRFSRSNSSS